MLIAQLWISSCMLLSNFYYVMNKIVKLNEILFLEKIGISKRLASLSVSVQQQSVPREIYFYIGQVRLYPLGIFIIFLNFHKQIKYQFLCYSCH